MLNFNHPYVLLLLIIPIILIIRSIKYGGHRVALPLDHQENKHYRWTSFLISLANTLPKILLAIAILLLASPRKFAQPKKQRELTNIQFCVDVSGSMSAKFGEGNRYEAAMQALNNFVKMRKGDAFALTIFGNNYLHWIPLTSDPSAFACAKDFFSMNQLPPGFGGTEIGKVLLACEKEMVYRSKNDDEDRMIILFSDGQSGDLNDKVTQTLKDANITLYAIQIGDEGVPPALEEVCSGTGGASYPAGDVESLEHIFKEIDSMKKTKFKRLTPDPIDNFKPYLYAALIITLLYLLSLFGLRYTPW